MCYTSGTTGNPKAALYSHRSTVLHAYAAALPDVMCLSARDSVLPVVPMFHVNAWGIPYSAALVGAKLVFPGPALDGKSVYELIEAEKVNFAAGVPTVWQMLLGHMKPNKLRFSTLKRTVIGGSACPPAMIDAFREDYGVDVLHAWGMTEMSPLGTLCTLKNKHLAHARRRADEDPPEAGPRDLRRGHEDHRRRRRGTALGRQVARRPVRQGPVDRRASTSRARAATRCVRRLVSHRRRGHHRRRRLHADHRPQQGRDQVRRRMDQLDRHRKHRRGASGRGDGGLHRHEAPQVGRAADRCGGQEARAPRSRAKSC